MGDHPLMLLHLESAVGIRELGGLRIGLTVGIHSDGSNLLLLNRTVIHASSGGSDGIHHIHTGGNLTKGGILVIQILGICMHDEELRAGRVGRLRTGHAENASLVGQGILNTVHQELTLDAVAGAAHAGAFRAAALNHEAGNDTMEDQAVIEVMIAQINEVIHALGGNFWIQLAFNDAAVFHGDLKIRIHS